MDSGSRNIMVAGMYLCYFVLCTFCALTAFSRGTRLLRSENGVMISEDSMQTIGSIFDRLVRL